MSDTDLTITMLDGELGAVADLSATDTDTGRFCWPACVVCTLTPVE